MHLSIFQVDHSSQGAFKSDYHLFPLESPQIIIDFAMFLLLQDSSAVLRHMLCGVVYRPSKE